MRARKSADRRRGTPGVSRRERVPRIATVSQSGHGVAAAERCYCDHQKALAPGGLRKRPPMMPGIVAALKGARRQCSRRSSTSLGWWPSLSDIVTSSSGPGSTLSAALLLYKGRRRMVQTYMQAWVETLRAPWATPKAPPACRWTIAAAAVSGGDRRHRVLAGETRSVARRAADRRVLQELLLPAPRTRGTSWCPPCPAAGEGGTVQRARDGSRLSSVRAVQRTPPPPCAARWCRALTTSRPRSRSVSRRRGAPVVMVTVEPSLIMFRANVLASSTLTSTRSRPQVAQALTARGVQRLRAVRDRARVDHREREVQVVPLLTGRAQRHHLVPGAHRPAPRASGGRCAARTPRTAAIRTAVRRPGR